MSEPPIHWLQHCGSWFGFPEPATFVLHKDGGYFASVVSGEPIHCSAANGYRNPEGGLAPWATRTDSDVITTKPQAIDTQDLFSDEAVVIRSEGERHG